MPKARSSSASHYAAEYSSAGVGSEDDTFYGIRLSSDTYDPFTAASPLELMGLFLLLGALLLKPRMGSFANRGDVSLFFWGTAFVLSVVFLREITWYPLLDVLLDTRTSYPYLVVFPHCLVSCASYRSMRSSSDTTTTHYLSSFAGAFFCYGFGGSIVSDVLLGLPVTALGHPRIVPCYVLGWLLVYHAPRDFVYASLTAPSSFPRYFCAACEAVDAVTTPMGRVSRSARELQNATTAPLLAGLFAGSGGAVLRYGERTVLQCRTTEHDALLAQLEAAVWRTLGYSVLWWSLVVWPCNYTTATMPLPYAVPIDVNFHHCASYGGSNPLRIALVVFHVVWTLACEAGVAHGHPFVWASETFRATVWTRTVRLFGLGPTVEEQKTEKKD